MNRKLLLSAALAAAIPLLPSAVAAQTDQQKQTNQQTQATQSPQAGQSQNQQGCRGEISAVDQKLEGMKQQRDTWNRTQVQLYIAEQFLQKGQPKNCLGAVQEARAILGAKTGKTPAGATQTTGQAGQTTAQDQDKNADTAGGSNIGGVKPEGWGTNEAQPSGGKPGEKSAPAQ